MKVRYIVELVERDDHGNPLKFRIFDRITKDYISNHENGFYESFVYRDVREKAKEMNQVRIYK